MGDESGGRPERPVTREPLQLPTERVREKRKEIAAAITDSAHPMVGYRLYGHTLGLIRSFAAQVADSVLPEHRRLRRRLKALILANRIIFWLMPVSAVCAVVWSYWLLVTTAALGLFWHFVINRFQTATNVDLGARTEVFCEMLAAEPEFRKRAEEALKATYGRDFSDFFSHLADAEPGSGGRIAGSE